MTEDTSEPERALDVRAVTSAYIYDREFKRSFLGGYVTREVDEFLVRVGDAFEAMAAKVRVLEEQLREQREQLDAYQRSEETLRNALVAAQKFSQDMVDAAKREAAALVEEARLVKERASSEAARLAADIIRDTDKLERQRTLLLTELRTILETHLSLLNSLTPDRDRVSPAPGRASPAARPVAENQSSSAATSTPDVPSHGGNDANVIAGAVKEAPVSRGENRL
jgi:cell division initiation protein